MANVKLFKLLGVMVALLLIVWGLAPIFQHQQLTNEVIANAIILVLIAVAYIVVVFNPGWTKAVFFFEGIIIAAVGYMLYENPYNIEFVVIGLILTIIAILAYLQKLPPKMLKWFYR